MGRHRRIHLLVVVVIVAGLQTLAHEALADFVPLTTVTLDYTGAQQDWTVPAASVTKVKIDAFGAQGGGLFGDSERRGGRGGETTTALAVTASQVLHVFVGGAAPVDCHGTPPSGGFNGGGAGDRPDFIPCGGVGGGGASDVRQGGTTLGHRVVVAGGGGGAGNVCGGGGCHARGGDGSGSNGENGRNADGNPFGGAGGDQTATAYPGAQFGQGADGIFIAGGGGGGGYVGGQGGRGGGGGGSGYPTTAKFQTGVRDGDGQVIISYGSPSFTSASSANFSSRAPGSFTVTTDGAPDATITKTGTLPTNVTLTDNGDGTATIAGSPPAAEIGSYPITLNADNGVGSVQTQSFTLNVVGAPSISSANHTTFTVGSPGTFTVTTGGTPNPAIEKDGTLPSGVSFFDNADGTATLSGTPGAGTAGTYPLTFTASNGVGSDAHQDFTLTVEQPPQITSANNDTFESGESETFTVTTTGDPTPALAQTDGSLPTGVSFTENGDGTATIAGTTTDPDGDYVIEITASNGVSPDAVQTFTLTVADTTDPSGAITFPESSGYDRAAWNAGCSTAGGDICGTASDTGSGVQKVEYSLRPSGAFTNYWDGAGFNSPTEQFFTATDTTDWSAAFAATNFPTTQIYTLSIRVTDNVGNTATASADFLMDPSPDTKFVTKPNAFTNQTQATFTYDTTDGSAATFKCRLDNDPGGFTDCDSSGFTTPTLSEGTHNFKVEAVSGGLTDPSPASYNWTVDTTAPETQLESHPDNPTNSTTASFSFSSNEAVTFTCQLDTGTAVSCGSGSKSYVGLSAGTHTFKVFAVDLAGNADPVPAEWTWTIDTTAPTVQIDSSPAARTASTTAAFTFSGSSDTALFTCILDTNTAEGCNGGSKTYTGLALGQHTFKVFATDGAGNSSTNATFDWTIDTTGPTVTITGGPAESSTTGPNVSFTLSSADADNDHFECKLDNELFANCATPKAYTALSGATHTFTVHAVDTLGNTGSDATRTWTVDAQGPTVTITGPGRTRNRRPTFRLSSSEPTNATFVCTLDGKSVDCSTGVFRPRRPLRVGRHRLIGHAVDQYGNAGADVTKSFRITQ